MGVTISSKNHSIDLGYGGFMRLKQKVAELTKEDVFEHYKKIEQGIIKFGDDRKSFFEDYNKRITEFRLFKESGHAVQNRHLYQQIKSQTHKKVLPLG